MKGCVELCGLLRYHLWEARGRRGFAGHWAWDSLQHKVDRHSANVYGHGCMACGDRGPPSPACFGFKRAKSRRNSDQLGGRSWRGWRGGRGQAMPWSKPRAQGALSAFPSLLCHRHLVVFHQRREMKPPRV